jgi:RecJ-like exonuclease
MKTRKERQQPLGGYKVPISEEQFLKQVMQLAKLRGWKTAHFRPAREKCKPCRGTGKVLGGKCPMCKGSGDSWRTAVQGDGKGWPDLVLTKKGRMIVAELKRSRKECPTDEQYQWLQEFEWIAEAAPAWIFVRTWAPEDWPEIQKLLDS